MVFQFSQKLTSRFAKIAFFLEADRRSGPRDLANASVGKCSFKIPLADVSFVLDCAHSEFFPFFHFSSYVVGLIQRAGDHRQYGRPGVGLPFT